MSGLARAKAVVARFARAAYAGDAAAVRAALGESCAPDAAMRLGFPFEAMEPLGFAAVLDGLAAAWPDWERREYIRIAGADSDGALWVGCAGFYTGTFAAPWLDIPATGQVVAMRYHEFFRIGGDRIVEMQALWDIPHVMMQAGVWPMVPSLGLDWQVPGPASGDGLGPHDPERSEAARAHVIDMLTAMARHPREGGPEVMELERYWHPRFMWYGPAGIGTSRGIDGFRRNHQIPFLQAMPDRGQQDNAVKFHFMAEGNYVGVTGWPNMRQTISGGGWLGIAPTGQQVEMRSLDFWRLEDGLIRENWVLVDLLSVFDQIGVDVFARMREISRRR